MNAFASIHQAKKVVGLLPEIWYALFFGSAIIGTGLYLIRVGGDFRNMIFLLIYLCFFGLLVKQFFRESKWINFFMGILFSLGSFYMLCAVVSEYDEFPLGTEPGAIKLIAIAAPLCGAFLAFAIWMLVKGIRKIYS